jgi:hypothetical protein
MNSNKIFKVVKMNNRKINKLSAYVLGVLLLLGAATAVQAEISYSLEVAAKNSWDIGSDKYNNVYIMWLSGKTINFGKIVNHAVTEQQTITTNANGSKYCVPRLVVRPDGNAMSIVYGSADQSTVMFAWRDNNGAWHNEIAYQSGTTKIYYPAGAVDFEGTLHLCFTKSGTIRYQYKKQGKTWTNDMDIDIRNSEGTRVVVDSKGGIHCTWMPYLPYLNYRYAAPGKTIDKSVTERISIEGAVVTSGKNINFSKTEIGEQPQAQKVQPEGILVVLGIGDLFITRGGRVHQTIAFGRKVWHTSKPIGGTFSSPVAVAGVDSTIDINSAVGADETGRVFTAWGEANSGFNYVKLGTYVNGKWTVETVTNNSNIDGYNKPAMTVTGNTVYLVWNRPNDNLHLLQIPLVPVSSPDNIKAEHLRERSFFKSFYFTRVTWEDSQYNIEYAVNVDHYNVYRKPKTDNSFSTTPFAANIPASTYTFDDQSPEANTEQASFDYYVTAVALIDGNLVESAIVF